MTSTATTRPATIVPATGPTTRSRAAAAALALAALLTGCAPQDTPEDPADAPTAEETTPSPTPSATPTPSPTATPTAPPADAAWPPASGSVQHGAQVWGAYVVATDSADAPEVADAHARLAAAGYETGGGASDVNCDQGAVEALGVDPAALVVAVYFDTEADARAFAELYGPDVVGVAPVTLYCLD